MIPIARRGSDEYFDLFERAAANAQRAAALLVEMVDDYPENAALGREILLCEQEGDSITHALIQKLAEGGRPPLPRSTVHRLATALDDVVDFTEQIADSFSLYKIEAPMEQAISLGEGAQRGQRTADHRDRHLAQRRFDERRDHRDPPARERGRPHLA